MAKDTMTNPTSTPFPIAYQIVQVETWTILDARGNPKPGYKVTFTFEGGFTDTIDIAEKDYYAENVKVAIEARITRHAGVLALG
jgi:hypothetical protein